MRKCRRCQNEIDNSIFICKSCKLVIRREKQEQKFIGLEENRDFVRCKFVFENGIVCNWPEKRLTEHLKFHQLTREQYWKIYPNTLLTCTLTKEKTAFRGQHSKETIEKMQQARLGKKPWNKGLKKEDHPGIQSIAKHARERMLKKFA